MPGVHLVSTDPNDLESAYGGGNPQPLDSNSGSTVFGAVLVTSGTWTFTASDTGGTGTILYRGHQHERPHGRRSADETRRRCCPTRRFIRERWAASVTRPRTAAAGSVFTATVYVTDAYSNPVRRAATRFPP